MASDHENTGTFKDALEQLSSLRRFSGPPAVFWQTYIDALAIIGSARYGLVVRRRKGEDTSWRKVVASPANLDVKGLGHFFERLESLCDSAAENGQAMKEISSSASGDTQEAGLAVQLQTGRTSEQWVAVFLLSGISPEEVDGALKRLLLANCLPADLQHYQSANRAPGAASQAASVIDLVVMLDGKHRFVEMAMAFVNELAGQHSCDRVSLGWEQKGYVRLKAISHSDKFERKMQVVAELETAMEEAFDQDEEIYYPPLEGETLITRDHGKFAASQAVKFMCSVPLRIDGEPVGIVTLERSTEPFRDDEIRLLRITADLAAPRLCDLKRRDRWIGARMATSCREFLGKAIGPEKVWIKVLAVSVAILLGVLFFGGMTYRVEAPFLLKTENVAYLAAPFDGYIANVEAEVGDIFSSGDRLLDLDTRDLLLEEAAAAADLTRYAREEEKARARGELAEMRIFAAQADQARVHLEAVRYHISQAEIHTPFDAFVIEGDLKRRLGAPVRKGDVLFKIARLDRLYVECKVNQRDIHEVRLDTPVHIAFSSQPKEKFPARVVLIEPVSRTEEADNVFIVRCQLEVDPADWWRPGMGGISKIETEWRSFFWIIFHRTIDFLRMFFWI